MKKKSRLTLNIVNEALRGLGYRKVELARGNGYYYFSGGIASRFYDSILGGSPHLNAWTLNEVIREFMDRVKEVKRR